MIRWFVALLLLAALRADDGFEFTARNYADYSATLSGNGYLLSATPWNGTAPATSAIARRFLQSSSFH